MDLGAVLALELDGLHAAELELCEQGLVVRGDLAQLSVLERKHLGKRSVVGFEQRRMRSAHGQRRDHREGSAGVARDRTSG